MRKIVLFILLSVMLASPCMAGTGVTADDGTTVELPEGYQVEKKWDLSNAVLSRLFGASWQMIAGGEAGDGDSGNSLDDLMHEVFGSGGSSKTWSYSGLIVAILGILNAAAMTYVAVAIIYMWGIFAVTTAHEGNKLGGSIYNSLWVPVRHACSFSLTVPVLNGLSLMQVAIMACMGLSINFANKIWDASGSYILNHTRMGIINASVPMFETEVKSMIPMMFESAVIQILHSQQQLPADGSLGMISPKEMNKMLLHSSNSSQDFKVKSKDGTIGSEHSTGKSYTASKLEANFAAMTAAKAASIDRKNYVSSEDLNWEGEEGNQDVEIVEHPLANSRSYARTNFMVEMPVPYSATNAALASQVSTLYTRYNHDNGEAIIGVMPPIGMPRENFGAVSIVYPKRLVKIHDQLSKEETDKLLAGEPLKFKVVYDYNDKDYKYYKLQKDLADARIEAVRNLWEDIYWLAGIYLSSSSSSGSQNCVLPLTTHKCFNELKPDDIIPLTRAIKDNYLRGLNEKTKTIIDRMINSEESKIKEMILNALDNDPETGKSKYGWMSAGLFSFTLASVQKRIDDAVIQHAMIQFPSDPGNPQKKVKKSYLFGLISRDGTESILDGWNDESKIALKRMSRFISSHVMGSINYLAASGATGEPDKLKELGSAVLKRFLFKDDVGVVNRGGMLNTVMTYFGTYDPIVAISSIGNRLLDVVPAAFITGTVADFVASSFVGTSAAAAIMIAGLIFAFIVPITPVIFWLKALLSWLFMVVEAMVAAPFWACSHALPEGPGFAGQHARRGYMMLLDIVIRPCLLVIGAVFAIAMIQVSGWFFNILFNAWFTNVASSFIKIGLMADITFAIIVTSAMYYISYTIFTKGVNYLPERVLYWCGGASGSGLRDEEHGTTQIVAAGAIMSKTQSGIHSAGQGVQNALSRTARASKSLASGGAGGNGGGSQGKSEIGQIAKA